MAKARPAFYAASIAEIGNQQGLSTAGEIQWVVHFLFLSPVTRST